MTCLQLLGAFHGAWMGIPQAVPTGKDLLVEPEQGPAAPVGQSCWKAAALCSFHSSCSLGCREGEGRKNHQKNRDGGDRSGYSQTPGAGAAEDAVGSQEWSSGAQGRMGVEVTCFRHERENEMGHVGGL